MRVSVDVDFVACRARPRTWALEVLVASDPLQLALILLLAPLLLRLLLPVALGDLLL